MAVYDDLRGWDTLPYLGSEFYCEYGDVDYAVTVPADMIVAGGGVLTNAAEVLTPLQRARLAQAAGSDATVMIRTPDEVTRDSARPAAKAEKTWRYHFANTRDVAFSASRAFVWDAARMNLPGGKTALAESVYPVESAGDAGWGRSTEYLKDSVERFSQHWFTYPYPTAWSIAGGSTGMEYPGMAFDGIPDKGKELFWITAHEIGHSWYPMVVGSNERRDAWMDEGFNTFIDTFESDEFKGGVFGPKRDSEYAPGGGNPVDEILPLLADRDAPPIMSYPDVMGEKYRHSVSYFKTALGLRLLRDVDPWPGPVRSCLPQIYRRLGVQTSQPVRLLPRDVERIWRRPQLVLARLVLQQLAARSGGDEHCLYRWRPGQGCQHHAREP